MDVVTTLNFFNKSWRQAPRELRLEVAGVLAGVSPALEARIAALGASHKAPLRSSALVQPLCQRAERIG
jgi:hypothetical protein